MTNNYALITGASGLLGNLVNQYLQARNITTIGLVHHRAVETDKHINDIGQISQITSHLDMVINLAGAPIAGAPWTKSRKNILWQSRVDATQHLIDSLKQQHIRCRHFISGSAIGFYGTGSTTKDETAVAGDDFSAELCHHWEQQAINADTFCDIVTVLRTGLVLTPKGGYLKPLYLTSKMGLGTLFGDGKQGVSWIDYRDWCAALLFIIERELPGAFNLTSPNPVSHREFMKTLTASLKRPRLFRLPTWAMQPMGEMKTLFLEGQYIEPTKLLREGFQFNFPQLQDSLNDLF